MPLRGLHARGIESILVPYTILAGFGTEQPAERIGQGAYGTVATSIASTGQACMHSVQPIHSASTI